MDVLLTFLYLHKVCNPGSYTMNLSIMLGAQRIICMIYTYMLFRKSLGSYNGVVKSGVEENTALCIARQHMTTNCMNLTVFIRFIIIIFVASYPL